MSALHALRRSLNNNYREGGVKQLFTKTFWHAQRWLHSETSWLIYHADVHTYDRQPFASLIRRELNFDSLRRHQYFKALDLPELIRHRLDSGAVCHGFFQDASLVNIAWTTSGVLELEPGSVILRDHMIGIFDCFTFTAHRSRGYYTQSLVNLIPVIRDAGAHIALIGVEPDNPASIKGIERAGFEPLYELKRSRRRGKDLFAEQPFQPRFAVNQQ